MRKWRAERKKRRPRIGEVADALGVDRNTVAAWIERGWLTAWYGNGTVAYIKPEAVKRALQRPEVRETIARAMARKAHQSTDA